MAGQDTAQLEQAPAPAPAAETVRTPITEDEAVARLQQRRARASSTTPEPEQAPQRARDERGKFRPAAQEQAPDEPEDDGEEAPEEGQPDPDDAEGEAPEADDDASGDEGEVEPAEPAIDAPHSWSKDDAKEFAKLPPAIQRKIAERESEREKFAQSKAQEAANVQRAVAQERQQVLAPLVEFLTREMQEPEPDWARLAQEDPYSYVQERARWDEKIRKVNAAQQHAQYLQTQQQEAQRRQYKAFLDEQRNEMLREIPAWRDPKVQTNQKRELFDHLLKRRFSPEELNGDENTGAPGWHDARLMSLAYDAMCWRKHKARQPQVENRVREAPRMQAPGKAQGRVEQQASQVQSAQKIHKREGTIDSALALLRAKRSK